MKKFAMLTLSAALAAWSGRSEPVVEAHERGQWRLSVGASVIGGVRSKVGANARGMAQMSRFGTTISQFRSQWATGRSKADAYALGSGAANGGKRIFDGGAWYDPTDSGQTLDGDYSWNWRLHDPSGTDPDGNYGFVERTAYEETSMSAVETRFNEGIGGDSTDWLPGLRIEASRELYFSDGVCPWGVDLAVAFAYYFQQDVWKSGGRAATASATEQHQEGYYEWWNDSHNEAQYILDYYRDSQFDGSMWGCGAFGGPGAELATDAWRFRDVVTRSEAQTVTHRLNYAGSGDYREYSIEAIARPWVEPWEWLRIFASLGTEVSRREFSWSIAAAGTEGSGCQESGKESDWRALGLFGGGLSLQWRGFFVTGEALWRFGGEDLEVSGRLVRGAIESGNWGFRASLGYEF